MDCNTIEYRTFLDCILSTFLLSGGENSFKKPAISKHDYCIPNSLVWLVSLFLPQVCPILTQCQSQIKTLKISNFKGKCQKPD